MYVVHKQDFSPKEDNLNISDDCQTWPENQARQIRNVEMNFKSIHYMTLLWLCSILIFV